MQILPGIVASRAVTPTAPAGSTGAYFDGSNDSLFKLKGTTATTSVGVWSFWINSTTLNTTSPTFDYFHRIRNVNHSSAQTNHVIYPGAGGTTFGVNFGLFDTDNTVTVGQRQTTSTSLAINTWHHIMFSFDISTATPVIQLYINDAAPAFTDTTPWVGPYTMNYGGVDHWIGRDSDGSRRINASLSEFYFAPEYIDLSVEANRRKFISAAGKPVYLGTDGSLPTGNVPYIYLKDPYTSFETNSGSSDNFTVEGALTQPSTYPAD